MRVVRTSKFRHVYGAPFRREECYDNIPISRSAWDTNFCCVNEKFVACILEVAGGGAFAVLTHKQAGKMNEVPRVTGHKGPVLDIAWNPFNSNMVASGSDDCTVKLWIIPDEGLETAMVDAVLTLDKHGRKVGQVCWHPTAKDMLFSSSADMTIKGWNVATGEDVLTFSCHPDSIFWFSFDMTGSKMATTCKDKKLRILDARTGDVLCVGDGPQGSKPSRCVYLGDTGRVITTGFSKQHERQYTLYDDSDLSQLTTEVLDTSSGILMPFYDSDLKIIYMAGKGDGNIRFFEFEDDPPYVHYLSQFMSTEPQRGIGYLPKRAVDVSKCEIARMYKLYNKNVIEPISFIVPRKSDSFQEDLFPDTQGYVPSVTAEEWLGGVENLPQLISLKEGFVAPHVEYVAPAAEPKNVEAKPQGQDYEEECRRLEEQVKQLKLDLAAKDKRIEELEVEVKKNQRIEELEVEAKKNQRTLAQRHTVAATGPASLDLDTFVDAENTVSDFTEDNFSEVADNTVSKDAEDIVSKDTYNTVSKDAEDIVSEDEEENVSEDEEENVSQDAVGTVSKEAREEMDL